MTMIKNQTFRQCLNSIPTEERKSFEESFDIAERLAVILKDERISISEFSKMVGRPKATIGRWLTGRYKFTPYAISRIERALNCKLT